MSRYDDDGPIDCDNPGCFWCFMLKTRRALDEALADEVRVDLQDGWMTWRTRLEPQRTWLFLNDESNKRRFYNLESRANNYGRPCR